MNPDLLKSIEDACIKNIKSEGAFDKLRSECFVEIEKEYHFQQLNTQIDEQIINFVKAKDRSIASQSKSEVRKGMRSHLNTQLNGILKSQMDSLVDSIIKNQEGYLKDVVKQAVDSFSVKEKGDSKEKVKIEPKSDNSIQVEGMDVVTEEKNSIKPDDDDDETKLIINCNDNNNNIVNGDNDIGNGELYISMDSERDTAKDVVESSN